MISAGLLWVLLAVSGGNAGCLECHGLSALRSRSDRGIFIDEAAFHRSIHGAFSCVQCHEKAETVPHRGLERGVSCAKCHADNRTSPTEFHAHSFLGARLVADAAGLRVIAPRDASRRIPDRSCLECHDGVKAREARPIPAGTVHAGRACIDCHTTAGRKHGAETDSPLPAVSCGRCHVDEAGVVAATVHGRQHSKGDTIAPSCADCHGSHDIRRASDPASRVHPAKIAAMCLDCHGRPDFVEARGIRIALNADSFAASVHGRPSPTLDRAVAASCVDCHGAHSILPRGEAASSVNFTHLAGTCGRCHAEEAAQYAASSHGRAAARGAHEAPACSDCHGEHGILSATDPRSPTHRLAAAQELCLGCHDRPALAEKYGLPARRGPTYLDSYHGLAMRGRSTTAAVCSDCHGVHRILGEKDPASTIHPAHRVHTCGRCHADATKRFAASGPVHTTYEDHWLTNLVRIGYRFLIVMIPGGMLLWVLALTWPAVRRRVDASRTSGRIRFRRMEILQHALLVLSFVTLAVTGFALAFPDAAWVRLLAAAGLDEALRGKIHRIAGVLLIVDSVLHAAYLISDRGQWFLRKMVPTRQDPRHALDHILHAIGRRPTAPHMPHFSYFEKAEYWALVWGTALMTLTGLILWFPEALPRLLISVSEAIHYYEAILAASAILIWHMYFVFFEPDVYPFNPSIVTGRAARGTELDDRTE